MGKNLPAKNSMDKTKRKKNYRLRKSVRRTLGALFLISAIIVAAIPFPDAEATGGVPGTGGTVTPTLTYAVTKNTDINKDDGGNKIDLDPTSKTLISFSTLRYNGSAWRLEKQFDYYTIASPVKGAILANYNNTYSSDNISLPETVTDGEFIQALQSDYESYFAGTDKVTLNYADIDNDTGIKFKYFFPGKYEQLRNAGTGSIDGNVSEVEAGKRGAFYCDYKGFEVKQAGGGTTNAKFTGIVITAADGTKSYQPGYGLVQAEKQRDAGGVDVIYVLQAKNETQLQGGYRKDDNGFVYSILTSSFELIGIGERSFKGITNAKTLKLPGSLIYIGDNAFESSYVENITLTSVKHIGNYAFKGSRLRQVSLSTATLKIGSEAFSSTQLTSVTFPYSINLIGEGAFSNNDALTELKFDATSPLTISKFAFYNCPNLSSLDLSKQKIGTIGEGAFALNKVDSGKMATFKFPEEITKVVTTGSDVGLGDFVLSGRTQLKEVVMPSHLGYTTPVDLPGNIFYNCTGLSFVEFPVTSRYAKFANTMFSTVTNPDFYVKGPKYDAGNQAAGPRMSTWACKMNGGAYVPYVFEENGQKYYEVSDGNYLLLVDQSGKLLSCNFVGPAKEIELIIPGKVGNIQVGEIADGCFSPDFLQYIKKLTISDGGALKTIGNNAFAGAVKMTSVDIGDSVETIGESAFEGCTSLAAATIGGGVNKIGAKAFKNCGNLQNIIFETPINGASGFPKENIGSESFATGSAKLTITGTLEEGYGPFEYAMDSTTYVNPGQGIRVLYKTPAPSNLSVILDNRNGLVTLVDYPQYGDLDVGIRQKYETGSQMTPAEEAAVNAAINIDIPAGVESIDVKGYLNNEPYSGGTGETNSYNKTAYFTDPRFDNYAKHGLFGGTTKDDTSDPAKKNETKDIGNDRIRSVTMRTVKYLPNSNTPITGDILSDNGLSGGAFYSCENLETVSLGSAMEDVGSLPFLGCYNLSSIASDNPKYVCNNKILYENLADGSKKIVEVLGSRGNANDKLINVANDPDLANVSSMAVGAVSDVPGVRTVDFTGNDVLREIPDKAFLGSKGLSDVILPTSIRTIGLKAFAEGAPNNLRVSIYGREVSLATDAFVNTPSVTVYAYDDSAAYNTAKKIATLYDNVYVETLTDVYRVQFFDYDGITALSEVQYVEKGKNAELPETNPTRAGYVFKGWNKSHKDIQQDTDIIALYDIDPNNPGGGGNGNGNGTGGNGNGGNGTGGNGPVNGTTVPGGIDVDGDGIADYDKDGNKLYNLTVTGGNGTGRYIAGQKVSIMATGGATGSTFGNWSSSNTNVIFDDATKSTTTLIMPASDATVIANYAGQYRLEVKYGSGSGSYPAGTKVSISAVEPPAGKKFYRWATETAGLTIESSTSTTTTITMPSSNAVVEATYTNSTGTAGGGGGGGGNGVTGTTGTTSNNKTSVIITRPGISDTDQASAYVSGSTDGFVVKISQSAEADAAALAALQKEYPDMSRIKFAAMDISLYDATGANLITDTTGLKVNITMPIPDALRTYAGNNKIAGVVDETLDKLGVKFVTMNGVPCMSFTATHFSPYVVYVDTGNLVAGDVLDQTPKTGDGIHPKWFLSIGLASISMILFLKRDPKYKTRLS